MTDYFPKTYGNRNPYFEALLKEGTNTSPIGAHSQGASRLAFALLAGLERGQMDREQREARQPTQPKPTDPNPAGWLCRYYDGRAAWRSAQRADVAWSSLRSNLHRSPASYAALRPEGLSGL